MSVNEVIQHWLIYSWNIHATFIYKYPLLDKAQGTRHRLPTLLWRNKLEECVVLCWSSKLAKMFGILGGNKGHKIKGTVVLMSKNVLDFNEIVSTTQGGLVGAATGIFGAATGIVGGVVDGATAIFSRNIAIQLISATKTDGLFH